MDGDGGEGDEEEEEEEQVLGVCEGFVGRLVRNMMAVVRSGEMDG